MLTGGNVDGLGAAALFDLPFASYAFDLIAGPENWRLIAEAPGDRGIVCGALDPADTADDRPEPLVWAAHYAASTRGRGLERVGLANASSLASLPRDRAIRKLAALAEAARLASIADPHELAASLDPRAVDARSAALGRYRRAERTIASRSASRLNASDSARRSARLVELSCRQPRYLSRFSDRAHRRRAEASA